MLVNRPGGVVVETDSHEPYDRCLDEPIDAERSASTACA